MRGQTRLPLGHGAAQTDRVDQRGGFVGQWTPLHEACRNGHPEVVELLIDHGADIEAKDGVQRTPLIITAESENARVAEILIDCGADINAQAIRGYTALLWAARNDFEDGQLIVKSRLWTILPKS